MFPKTADGQVEIDTGVTLVDTWRAMIKLPETGKVRAVGVSNFTVAQIEALVAATGFVPAANQVEAHPLLPQDELLAYGKKVGMHLTAYSPLGNNSELDICVVSWLTHQLVVGKPRLTDHKTVTEIAAKTGATPAQVLIAWAAQKGFSVIPKSVQEGQL